MSKGTPGGSRPRILAIIRAIPKGTVMTYGLVAKEAGLPHGARQVGYALHDAGRGLPWHRVLGTKRPGLARISLPGEPAVEQRLRLEAEGIVFSAHGTVDLARFGPRNGRRSR